MKSSLLGTPCISESDLYIEMDSSLSETPSIKELCLYVQPNRIRIADMSEQDHLEAHNKLFFHYYDEWMGFKIFFNQNTFVIPGLVPINYLYEQPEIQNKIRTDIESIINFACNNKNISSNYGGIIIHGTGYIYAGIKFDNDHKKYIYITYSKPKYSFCCIIKKSITYGIFLSTVWCSLLPIIGTENIFKFPVCSMMIVGTISHMLYKDWIYSTPNKKRITGPIYLCLFGMSLFCYKNLFIVEQIH